MKGEGYEGDEKVYEREGYEGDEWVYERERLREGKRRLMKEGG
jgi:hypothetical protein